MNKRLFNAACCPALGLSLLTLVSAQSAHGAGCAAAPPTAHEAKPEEIHSYFRDGKKNVLTFLGYSGAGYEDPEKMLKEAAAILAKHKKSRTMVNIGATAEGIGAVYELAKQKGFATTGIVSTQARDSQAALSPCVDTVFFVKDETWGGYLPGTKTLSPTSTAMVANSDELVAIGGGDVARDELTEAKRLGKRVRFIPADMNHQAAIDKAKKKGLPEPTGFGGTAAEALADGTGTDTQSSVSSKRPHRR